MLRVLAGGAFSLSLGLIREVCPLDLSMETTTRNTIILTNKGLAFMTHADNQSGVLSKSSRESTSFLTAADYITQTLTNIASAISMSVLTTGSYATTTATTTGTGGWPG